MAQEYQKTVLIAAPGSGIGRIVTEKLVKDFYRVIGIGGKNSKEFVDVLNQNGYSIDFVECDYTSESSVIEAFNEVKLLTPKIDGLIIFVGGSLFSKTIDDISYSDFRQVLAVNLDSTFLIGREGYIWMKEKNGGNIIFFGSTTGLKPSLKKMPYGVAKAAVHSLTLSFAQEGAEYKIITNAIAPGYVMTDRHIDELKNKATETEDSLENIMNKIKSKNPMRQQLDPEDIYPLIKVLLTTSHIQGQVIRIDSGQILG